MLSYIYKRCKKTVYYIMKTIYYILRCRQRSLIVFSIFFIAVSFCINIGKGRELPSLILFTKSKFLDNIPSSSSMAPESNHIGLLALRHLFITPCATFPIIVWWSDLPSPVTTMSASIIVLSKLAISSIISMPAFSSAFRYANRA